MARGIGSSSNPGAPQIPNVSSYDDVSFVSQAATIADEEFTYGMKFQQIVFDLNNEWEQVYLYCVPTDTETTINVKLDSDSTGTDYTVDSTHNLIQIPLNGNSSMTLSSNEDVILYKVYHMAEIEVTPGNTVYTVRDIAAPFGTQNRQIAIPSQSELESLLITQLGLDSNSNLQITNINGITMTARVGGTSSYSKLRILDGSTTVLEININTGAGTYQLNPLDDSYLGKTLSAQGYYNGSWLSADNCVISKCIIDIDYTYETSSGLGSAAEAILIDGTTYQTLINNSITTEDVINQMIDESSGYDEKYDDFIRDAIYGLIPFNYSSMVANPTHTGAASINIIEILELNEQHSENDYCVPEFIKLFIESSNEAFKLFIAESVANSVKSKSDFNVIFNYFITKSGYYCVLDAINARNNSLTIESKCKVAAAYLASDYKYIINNGLSISTSKLKTYVDTLEQKYQYITDNTYDNVKFKAFCDLIGYNLSTAGYGIYALASNQGKLNGEFIPDNLVLSLMDSYYTTNSNVVYKLVESVSSNALNFA